MSQTNGSERLDAIGKRRRAKSPKAIDLDFRPETYFWPLNLETHLLSHVKGANRREILKAAVANNQIDPVFDLLGDSELPDDTREALSRIHPSFLGGEFLANREENEVEIARVTLDSVTSDVTSVYARFQDGVLHYRVVDEYDGETLTGPTTRTSGKPLTLGELIEFLYGAWPIVWVLDVGFQGSITCKLGCFEAESAFYPQIDALYKRRVKEGFRRRRAAGPIQ
jgi:hypothetical protein